MLRFTYVVHCTAITLKSRGHSLDCFFSSRSSMDADLTQELTGMTAEELADQGYYDYDALYSDGEGEADSGPTELGFHHARRCFAFSDDDDDGDDGRVEDEPAADGESAKARQTHSPTRVPVSAEAAEARQMYRPGTFHPAGSSKRGSLLRQLKRNARALGCKTFSQRSRQKRQPTRVPTTTGDSDDVEEDTCVRVARRPRTRAAAKRTPPCATPQPVQAQGQKTRKRLRREARPCDHQEDVPAECVSAPAVMAGRIEPYVPSSEEESEEENPELNRRSAERWKLWGKDVSDALTTMEQHSDDSVRAIFTGLHQKLYSSMTIEDNETCEAFRQFIVGFIKRHQDGQADAAGAGGADAAGAGGADAAGAGGADASS